MAFTLMLNLRSLITALSLAATMLSSVAHAAYADMTFTVTNTGNGPLTISGASISGNPTDFALRGSTCTTTVAPGGSCDLTVRFTPSGSGPRAAAALNFSSNGSNGPAHSIALNGAGQHAPASCKVLLDSAPGTPSGTYTIDPDGSGAVAPFSAFCDMTSSGGGWTMVVRQYEGSPVVWTGQASGSSFTLAQAKIPAHTQVAFGTESDPTAIDYVAFQYTTGDIPKTVVTGLATGLAYHVHRSVSANYDSHNPDSALYSYAPYAGEWHSTLTFDRAGGYGLNWAFSPYNSIAADRGYSFGGGYRTGIMDAYAWAVWVR